jgi:hypothetical protein
LRQIIKRREILTVIKPKDLFGVRFLRIAFGEICYESLVSCGELLRDVGGTVAGV